VRSDPDFKVTTFFEVEYRKKTARLKDKVTIAQEEKYLTYGMLLCLVTLTDLQLRRAGLSASAELLVVFVGPSVLNLGTMYATDRQTSDVVRRQTSDAHHRLMPPPYRGGGIIIYSSLFTT